VSIEQVLENRGRLIDADYDANRAVGTAFAPPTLDTLKESLRPSPAEVVYVAMGDNGDDRCAKPYILGAYRNFEDACAAIQATDDRYPGYVVQEELR
jgi:hypothetical protein